MPFPSDSGRSQAIPRSAQQLSARSARKQVWTGVAPQGESGTVPIFVSAKMGLSPLPQGLPPVAQESAQPRESSLANPSGGSRSTK